jgi:hypothetical protein
MLLLVSLFTHSCCSADRVATRVLIFNKLCRQLGIYALRSAVVVGSNGTLS